MRRHHLNNFNIGDKVYYVGKLDINSIGKSGVVLHINGRGVCVHLEDDPCSRWFLYSELEYGSPELDAISHNDLDLLLMFSQ